MAVCAYQQITLSIPGHPLALATCGRTAITQADGASLTFSARENRYNQSFRVELLKTTKFAPQVEFAQVASTDDGSRCFPP